MVREHRPDDGHAAGESARGLRDGQRRDEAQLSGRRDREDLGIARVRCGPPGSSATCVGSKILYITSGGFWLASFLESFPMFIFGFIIFFFSFLALSLGGKARQN